MWLMAADTVIFIVTMSRHYLPMELDAFLRTLVPTWFRDDEVRVDYPHFFCCPGR